jgi:hypothetical protein
MECYAFGELIEGRVSALKSEIDSETKVRGQAVFCESLVIGISFGCRFKMKWMRKNSNRDLLSAQIYG